MDVIATPPPVDLPQAEAALIANYPRLARIAYLTLPAGLGRPRRVLTAHALVQRALPRGGTGQVPRQRQEDERDPGYAYLRLRVLAGALAQDTPRRPFGLPKRAQLPPGLPRVWGLRLFPRSGGSDELALDHTLAALPTSARAAFVLRALEDLPDRDVRRLLGAAGATDARAAIATAAATEAPADLKQLLLSPEFDPCTLQARPTDLMRRRQHTRAALAAAAALAACGALLGLPGNLLGGPEDAAAPAYAQNEFARAALEPGRLLRAGLDDWRRASRPDFAAWPARGSRTDDTALLSRALRVWARPSTDVHLSTTPGTPAGPPAGPPQLLYAGDVSGVTVVVFHDALRIVRYAEPRGHAAAQVALDFARTDGADAASATALVIQRVDDNVRYLTAPWVSGVAVRDLLRPGAPAKRVDRGPDGVTELVDTPATARECGRWSALEFRMRAAAGVPAQLATDLGELTPASLSYGSPDGPAPVAGAPARTAWARTACALGRLRGTGVRQVNAWTFADQDLPEGAGTAAWICTRAETWRGSGAQVLAQFRPPNGEQAAIAARATDTTACGARAPRALAGVLWQSASGSWYVLAAGSRGVTSVAATGGVHGSADGRYLALPAAKGARAELTARTADGTELTGVG
ncbi:hypothetical protein SRB5_12670 [Streptomyces sp. RB5]|uniref:DNA-directed RNA polymerase specialized sigma24 family protein n=1 Tax=Streptomyces smaragdinus TaxID=2585196 RepID=A0A7K0CCS7_9ACTN|nr:hypothetical protein [Streptomyces smaragdinus]MQY11153.1 hypothetical protein [Streptomyces smaragdinus]